MADDIMADDIMAEDTILSHDIISHGILHILYRWTPVLHDVYITCVCTSIQIDSVCV